MSEPPPAERSSSSSWALWVSLVLALYVLSVGPMHGLYYNERLSEIGEVVFKWLYMPLNELELRLPEGNVMSRYKYWWYIYLKYGRPPVNGGPPT